VSKLLKRVANFEDGLSKALEAKKEGLEAATSFRNVGSQWLKKLKKLEVVRQ
jgi:hypothetical protein